MNLIADKQVDWDGNCIFEEGKVTGFKHASARNNFSMRPIPKNDEVVRLAKEALPVVTELLKPATTDQIAIAIKKLSLHCGMQAKAPEDVKAMFLDYCNDLQEYSVALLEEACAAYRTSQEGSKFMPSSGQLIALMSDRHRKLKLVQKRIEKILDIDTPKQLVSIDDFLRRMT